MRGLQMFSLAAIALGLAACSPEPGQEPEEPANTEFEESVSSPLPEDGGEDAPITDNDSIEGGPDEATDEAFSGDNMEPEDGAE